MKTRPYLTCIGDRKTGNIIVMDYDPEQKKVEILACPVEKIYYRNGEFGIRELVMETSDKIYAFEVTKYFDILSGVNGRKRKVDFTAEPEKALMGIARLRYEQDKEKAK